jgi:hypothetical protein
MSPGEKNPKFCPFSPLTTAGEYCTVVLDDLLDKTLTIEGRALRLF